MPTNPLSAQSNSAVAMAFGMCVQSTPGTLPEGAFAAIADELKRRGLLADLLDHLGERSAAVMLAVTVDRTRGRRARNNSARTR